MSGNPSLDYHAKHSDLYERTAGNTTRKVATNILATISPPITPSSRVLDNACGPAIVASLIKSQCPSVPIVCVDLTEGMLEMARGKISTNAWTDVETMKQDLMNLDKLEDDTFSHVITNFGIQALASEDPEKKAAHKACEEIHRVLKPGGVCAISAWSNRAFIPIFKAIYPRVKPGIEPPNIDMPGQWEKGSWLMGVLEEAGFEDRVEVKCVDSFVEAPTVQDMAERFCLTRGWILKGYSDEEVEVVKGMLPAEIEKSKDFVRDENGVKLKMRAWIAFAWK